MRIGRNVRLSAAALLACVLAIVAPAASTQDRPPYRDSRLPVEMRVRDLLGRMTLEEKFWQLFMLPGSLDDPSHDYSRGVFGLQVSMLRDESSEAPALARRDAERINAIQRYFVERTRLGIPIIPFEEAVHGLRRAGATMFPQAIGLAATWDVHLMSRVAAAIAAETRARGIRQVLSPVVNLADDVRWGRVEETYGEDPYLASAMARAFVSAVERAGIVATPKHFVANVGAGGRDSYPIDRSERALAERDFPPFQAALEAGARSIMTAYNSVDGRPATQNARLLNGRLKGDWMFRGFVISDAAATGGAVVLHKTEPTTPAAAQHAWEAGLDVVFQSAYGQQQPYLQAVQKRLVPEATIDAAVARVLRTKFELGLFEQPYVDVDEAARANGHADHTALAREAARASVVLLKNARARLPIAPGVRRIVVIGQDATEARLGGYSAPGVTRVSIWDAIQKKVATPKPLLLATGPGRVATELETVPATALSVDVDGKTSPGLRGEYFDNNRLVGTPRLSRTDRNVDFRWTLNAPGRGIPFDWYSVRWTGRITAPAGGMKRIGVEGNDGYRLWLDGRLAIDNWVKRSYGRQVTDVDLVPGSVHDLRLEYFETTGNARLRLIWDGGAKDESEARIAEAVEAARRSELAVIVAGLEEGEFRDRASLRLPGRQEELIQRVAATGTPVVVVIVGGSAVTMSSWLDRVDAVLMAWYPGEQGGRAVADILWGDANPAGRLPITFPMSEGQLPLTYDHKPTGRSDDYLDLTGMPLFPFGYGLSYTAFEYSGLRIEPAAIDPAATATVRCRITNTGSRAGDEVVQLYVRDLLASVAQPVLALKGFWRVHLKPGESTDVAFTVGPRELRLLDADMKWIVESGDFRILVGASSKDIRLRGMLTVRSAS